MILKVIDIPHQNKIRTGKKAKLLHYEKVNEFQ